MTPTIEQVLAAIEAHPATDYQMPDGRKLVQWQNLAFALFPKSSPAWRKPQGQPHGRDESEVTVFMSRLGALPEIQAFNFKGGTFFARRIQ